MNKTLTCILCPIGCDLRIEYDGTTVHSVTGNHCKKGDEYAHQEIISPMRNIASSVLVDGGHLPLCSVRLSAPIPKDRIMDVMDEIKKICIAAPVHLGDIIIENVLDLGADVIATKNIEKL